MREFSILTRVRRFSILVIRNCFVEMFCYYVWFSGLGRCKEHVVCAIAEGPAYQKRAFCSGDYHLDNLSTAYGNGCGQNAVEYEYRVDMRLIIKQQVLVVFVVVVLVVHFQC